MMGMEEERGARGLGKGIRVGMEDDSWGGVWMSWVLRVRRRS